MPHFFSIKLSANPVQFLNFEEIYSSDPIQIKKNCYSPDQVQSKSSPMLIFAHKFAMMYSNNKLRIFILREKTPGKKRLIKLFTRDERI